MTLGRAHRLDREQVVPRPPGEVFAFFSDARNLEILTPAFLRFEILTPGPIPMAAGAIIDYRIRLFGIPRRWRTRIEVFEPPRRFVDVQIRGPYARWRHLHEFEAVPGGTRLRDSVEYTIPFGPIGSLARTLFVKATLDRIFDHRARTIREMFGDPPPPDRSR